MAQPLRCSPRQCWGARPEADDWLWSLGPVKRVFFGALGEQLLLCCFLAKRSSYLLGVCPDCTAQAHTRHPSSPAVGAALDVPSRRCQNCCRGGRWEEKQQYKPPFLLAATWLYPQLRLGGLPQEPALVTPLPQHMGLPMAAMLVPLGKRLPGQ